MKSMIAFWTVSLAVLGGLLFWRNTKNYQRPWRWRLGKSAVELSVLLLAAAFLPALLIVWLVVWATRPIKNPWIRTIVGIVSGVLFGFFSNIAVEVLVLCGVFAVDLKTGAHDQSGFLSCWQRAKQEH